MEQTRFIQEGYSIDFKDLKAGDYHFSLKFSDDLFTPYEECEVLGGDGKIEVDMERSEGMIALDVTINGSVRVECDRCLEPCDIAVEFAAPLIVKFSDNEELYSEYDGEVMWMPTTASSVDLAHYIYESIIISLPYQRVHEEGGCNPEMIARFTPAAEIYEGTDEEAEEAESDEEESVSLPQSELAKLMALKEKMTK